MISRIFLSITLIFFSGQLIADGAPLWQQSVVKKGVHAWPTPPYQTDTRNRKIVTCNTIAVDLIGKLQGDYQPGGVLNGREPKLINGDDILYCVYILNSSAVNGYPLQNFVGLTINTKTGAYEWENLR